jgi:hypothetical protein
VASCDPSARWLLLGMVPQGPGGGIGGGIPGTPLNPVVLEHG